MPVYIVVYVYLSNQDFQNARAVDPRTSCNHHSSRVFHHCPKLEISRGGRSSSQDTERVNTMDDEHNAAYTTLLGVPADGDGSPRVRHCLGGQCRVLAHVSEHDRSRQIVCNICCFADAVATYWRLHIG